MRSVPKEKVSVVVLDFLVLPLTFFCHVEAKVGFWPSTVEILSMGPLWIGNIIYNYWSRETQPSQNIGLVYHTRAQWGPRSLQKQTFGTIPHSTDCGRTLPKTEHNQGFHHGCLRRYWSAEKGHWNQHPIILTIKTLQHNLGYISQTTGNTPALGLAPLQRSPRWLYRPPE